MGKGRNLAALGLAALCLAAPSGADILERAARLGRGVNFGNALEAPKEGEWGLTLKESYFQAIAAAGFGAVRVPIKWSAHAAAQPPYAIDPAFFARIDWVLSMARKYGLAIVINVHGYDEMNSDPARHKARWIGLWKQIAARYEDQGPEVYFELLNEPNSQMTAALWNQYLAEGLAAIRATNPARPVVIGPTDWNAIGRLKDLSLPEADRNLIVTVHYYEPYHFTHQGTEWNAGSSAWLGLKWGSQADRDALEAAFQDARDWAAAHRRPLFVGEFGAYGKADMASRALWTRSVARAAEKYGFSWAYWEFGSGFGVYNPAASQWRAELKDALVGDPIAVRGQAPVRAPRTGIRFDGGGRPSGVAVAGPGGRWTDLQGRTVE